MSLYYTKKLDVNKVKKEINGLIIWNNRIDILKTINSVAYDLKVGNIFDTPNK